MPALCQRKAMQCKWGTSEKGVPYANKKTRQLMIELRILLLGCQQEPSAEESDWIPDMQGFKENACHRDPKTML
eukprot:330490-Pyramimonas_sp.AAC.1